MDKSNTVLLLANGPSLNDIPANFIDSYTNCGLNFIFLKEDISPVDFYVAINPEVIEQGRYQIDAYAAQQKFIRADRAAWFQGSFPLRSVYTDTQFSEQPWLYVWEGWTVTYVALQILAWKGFKTILIAGLDHYYQFDGAPNELKKMEGPDTNHFSPAYFSGKRWNNPDLDNSEKSYKIARAYADAHGIDIVNISTKTALPETIFRRDDWTNWLVDEW